MTWQQQNKTLSNFIHLDFIDFEYFLFVEAKSETINCTIKHLN